jgi:hypothetical protein
MGNLDGPSLLVTSCANCIFFFTTFGTLAL